MIKISEIYGMFIVNQKYMLINQENRKICTVRYTFFLLRFKLSSPNAKPPKKTRPSKYNNAYNQHPFDCNGFHNMLNNFQSVFTNIFIHLLSWVLSPGIKENNP